MATNWPPSVAYPSWPPAEINTTWMSFSDVHSGIYFLRDYKFTWENPTAKENQDYFSQVKCDKGHPCQGIMIISPTGVRYPFAYCTGSVHKSALVLWIVGYNSSNQPCYDLGFGSGSLS